ncbi:hypothetical protein A3J16_05705 [Candidatus Daviesbacteria bacterium RIFCSPLOWO2_02_FULL_39_13]|nr:MAG: hypothetical protein A3J16_05705 [Candidatus Daviesbacteria bacterium RIFCSPLOWO2_02_FULL_39_13]
MSDGKAVVDLAIIIPTLNEEHFIGRLLDSLIKQTVRPKELVVVDAFSKDKTIEEVKKRQKQFAGLRYFRIPKSTISRQRNLGVKKTTSGHLLFLDADMILGQPDTLEKYFADILIRKPDVAAASSVPDSNYWKDILYFKAEDLGFKLSQYIWPVIPARNLCIRREIFEKAGGFDETVIVAEDQDLVHRIIKKGSKLIWLKNVRMHTSVRRIKHEGRRKYVLKMLLFGLKILLWGRRKSKVEYEFGHFNSET